MRESIMVVGYNNDKERETVLDVVCATEAEVKARDYTAYREHFKYIDFIDCYALENGNGWFEGVEYKKGDKLI